MLKKEKVFDKLKDKASKIKDAGRESADGPDSSDKYKKIKEVLKNKGVELANIATNPRVFDKACDIAYKRIPIPLRWFVGKKRVKKMMNKLKEQIPQTKRQPRHPGRPVSGRL